MRNILKRDSLTVALLLFLVLLSGCKWPVEKTSRYEMITTATGQIYRLDNQSGVIHFISPNGMSELHELTPMLEVGRYYEMPDAAKNDDKFLEYIGQGKFEKSKFAILKAKGENTSSKKK